MNIAEDLRVELAIDGPDTLHLAREGRGVTIVSDLHLGLEAPLGFPRELEPVLATLVSEAGRRGDIVVLAGDILDAGARARDAAAILHLHPRLEEALAVAAETSELVYVPGNHDPPQHEIVKALKWRVASRLVLDDDLLVLHGDELDEGLRSTFVGRLGDVMLRAQQAAGTRIEGPVSTQGSVAGRLLAGVTLEAALLADRHVQNPDVARFVDDNVNYLVSMEEQRDPRFVLRALAALRLPPAIRRVVCGHTHHPGIARVGDLEYVNAGTWSRRFATAVLIRGDRCEVRDIVTGRTFGEEAYAAHEEPSSWRDYASGPGAEARLGPALRHAVSTVVGRAGKVTSDSRRTMTAVFGTLPRLTRHAPERASVQYARDDENDAADGAGTPFAVRFVERLTGVARTFDAPSRSRAVTVDLRASFAPGQGERSATLEGGIVIDELADGPVSGTLTFEVRGGGSLTYDLRFDGLDGAAHRLFGRKLVRFSELGRSLTELPAALTRAGEPVGEAELVFDARRELGAFVRSIALTAPRVRTVARNPSRWAETARRTIDRLDVEGGGRRRVLVTGATGHLGHNLVAQLLARGHHVTAVVRRLRDEARVTPLRALAASRPRDELVLVEADLVSPSAVRRALESAPDVVIHTASAFQLVGTDEQRTVVEPTVLATVHVMREAARAGVERVVLTSSVAALGTDASGRDPLHEGDWNRDAANAYHRAKTLSERRAWEIAQEDGLDLVVLNPSTFLGPNFFRHTPTTRVLADLVAGRALVTPPFDLSWVDVRDVAWAHVLAAESASARGRYVVSTAYLSFDELVQRLLALDPHVQVPTRTMPKLLAPLTPAIDWARSRLFGVERAMSTSLSADLSGKTLRVSSARVERELGWSPIDVDVSLGDTLAWLREQYES